MTQRSFVVSFGAVLLLAWSVSTFAHHSVAATYLIGKSVTIDGTLKEFLWRNPHSFMRVEAADEKGQKHIWVIEGAAPQQLTESGLSQSTLRPGDRVIVTGSPSREPSTYKLHLKTVERPADGWRWAGQSDRR